jgi:uncharacterized membrane protein
MAENKTSQALWKMILGYFFQGLIVLAPIGVTLYAVVWLFKTVDGLLPNFMLTFLPAAVHMGPDGAFRTFPGMGFIFVVLIVFAVGWISSNFFVSRFVDLLDGVLQRTPGVKFIYTAVRDLLQAFAGNKRKFDKPVLANVGGNDVWRVGFITQETASRFGMEDHSVVYIPLSYAITGITYIVPKKNIKLLEGISSADAMRFALSGGVTDAE